MTTLREMREARALSLRAVAGSLGFSHVFLGEMERGLRPIPTETRVLLARFYGVPNEAVVGRAPQRLDLRDLTEEQRARIVRFVEAMRAEVAA